MTKLILSFLILILCFIEQTRCITYSIVMPKLLHLGREENIFVYTNVTPAILTIEATDSTKVPALNIFQKDYNIKNNTSSLLFKINASTSAETLNINLKFTWCVKDPCTVLEHTARLPLVPHQLIIFTETSKPIYKPSELVRFRSLLIDAISLAPPSSTFQFDTIYVENPSESRMASWTQTSWKQAFNGLSYRLSADPEEGTWRIISQSGSVRYIHNFSVKKYTLPKFSVIIKGPPEILITDTKTKVMVCAQYSTGRPIKSSALVNICLKENSVNLMCKPSQQITFTGSESCISIDMNVDISSDKLKYFYYGSVYHWWVEAVVEEEGTGEQVTENTDLGQMQYTKMSIKIIAPPFYQSGLPYFFKILSKHHDGTPFIGAKVKCNTFSEWSDNNVEKTSDPSGQILITIPQIPSQYQNIHLTCYDVVESSSNKMASNSMSSIRYQISSNQNIGVVVQKPIQRGTIKIYPLERMPKSKAKVCAGVIDIKLLCTIDPGSSSLTILLLTRGAVTPIKTNDNSIWVKDNIFTSIYSKIVTLNLDSVEYSDGTLLIYAIGDGGYIMADTTEFNILNECIFYANEGHGATMFQFRNKEVKPGETVTTNIIYQGTAAQCSLKINDVNLNHFGDSGNVGVAQLSEYLQTINEAKFSDNDPFEKLFDSVCSNSFFTTENQLIDQFRKVGTMVFTNIQTYDKNSICQFYLRKELQNAPMFDGAENKMMIAGANEENEDFAEADSSPISPKPTRVRTNFPETWMFDILTDPVNSLNLTAPDTLTSWESNFYCLTSKGLGIAQPGYLTVFTSFYLQLTLPYSIFRGEVANIPVKVFNYLSECLEVDLEISTTSAIIIESEPRVKLCVCGYDSKTAYFKIKAIKLGNQNITVTASNLENNKCSGLGSPSTSVSDAVQRSILVEAEGFPERATVGDLICVKNEQKFINLMAQIPENVVPDSARGYAIWTADILGPSLSNLDSLIQMPYGCGEQNMISLVPSIYVLDYFKAMKIKMPQIETKARSYILVGYERELMYHRKDGSFSAFGDSDKAGSTWLTAFVIKSFIQAGRYITVDPLILSKAIGYLIKQQDDSGCFQEKGQVIHSSMKGASMNDLASLTAYVLTAILETNEALLSNRVNIINAAINCIRQYTPSSISELPIGSIALRTYALGLAKSVDSFLYDRYKTSLLNLKTSANNMIYWSPPAIETQDTLRWWEPTSTGEIETTAYALLALIEEQSVLESLKTVRWLNKNQNANGGWVSTQDTVVGLNSLAVFAQKMTNSQDSILTVNATGINLSQVERIDKDKRQMTWKIPISVPNSIQFSVTGTGCVVIKVATLFNLPAPIRTKPSFWTNVKLTGPKNSNKAILKGCSQLADGFTSTNMVVMQIQLMSGWTANKESVERLLSSQVREGNLKRVDDKNGYLEFYYDPFNTNDVKCFEIVMDQDTAIDNPVNATARVYDYYEPTMAGEASYSYTASASIIINSTGNNVSRITYSKLLLIFIFVVNAYFHHINTSF